MFLFLNKQEQPWGGMGWGGVGSEVWGGKCLTYIFLPFSLHSFDTTERTNKGYATKNKINNKERYHRYRMRIMRKLCKKTCPYFLCFFFLHAPWYT